MWRFYRINPLAIYDCEDRLLWLIADPADELDNEWNVWEIYDRDGLRLYEYYEWWGRWDICDANEWLVGRPLVDHSAWSIAEVYSRVKAFRITLWYLHHLRQILDS